MFTARVPGLGLVEWTPEQVDDYAQELQQTHRTGRLKVTWRGRGIFRWPAIAEGACRQCHEPWPCPSAWWADRHQTSAARLLSSSLR